MTRNGLEALSDEFLVLASIAGDFASFDELARRYRPAVTRQLAATVGPEEAQDVAQEAFLRAFRALPRLTSPQAFGSWLRRIAERCAGRRGRSLRRREGLEAPLDAVVLATCPSLAPGPEEVAIDAMFQEGALGAIRSLPEPYRETIELRFMQDMPLKRIAAYQGISSEGVKWRLRRALAMLREELQKLGNARVTGHTEQDGGKGDNP
jgi:RNA polymerase sigma-70 factor (ECF subfamily)